MDRDASSLLAPRRRLGAAALALLASAGLVWGASDSRRPVPVEGTPDRGLPPGASELLERARLDQELVLAEPTAILLGELLRAQRESVTIEASAPRPARFGLDGSDGAPAEAGR